MVPFWRGSSGYSKIKEVQNCLQAEQSNAAFEKSHWLKNMVLLAWMNITSTFRTGESEQSGQRT